MHKFKCARCKKDKDIKQIATFDDPIYICLCCESKESKDRQTSYYYDTGRLLDE